jgi:hypothetical protein
VPIRTPAAFTHNGLVNLCDARSPAQRHQTFPAKAFSINAKAKAIFHRESLNFLQFIGSPDRFLKEGIYSFFRLRL